MLNIQYPLAVKFICGFIYADNNTYQQAKKLLVKKYGPLDYESQELDFNFTAYYQKEMGTNLKRRFIAFKNLRNPSEFVKIKLYTIKLEKKFAPQKKRKINIDPGYINEAKLVLTTTKDFHHRIYLGKGIFAEITLAFSQKEKNFIDFPTTFPDYRTQTYKKILINIRNLYRDQLKKLKL